MEKLLVLPIVLPLITAGCCMLAARNVRLQRGLSFAGMLALTIGTLALFDGVRSEGILVTQAGAWPAPFGITLVADRLSAMLILLSAVVGLAVTAYASWSIGVTRERFHFYPLLNVLMLGICGSFLTGDLFNLYVCFEVMLMASFVLLTVGGDRRQLEGGVKYVILNLLSSAIFLTATGLLYGAVGTLNMADLAVRIAAYENREVINSLAMLFLVAFGLKAALFPFSFWLPASYHTPPFAVSAVFAGLLTKVGVYALLRVFTLLFVGDTDFTHTILALCAAASMVFGALAALAQQNIRRVFAFQIISTVGFMVLGIALGTPLAIAAVVFYLAQDVILKCNLFMLGGVADRLRGSGRLEHLGGFWRTRPFFSLLFLVGLLTLAGIPPFAGFWPKLALLRSTVEAGEAFLVGSIVAAAFLTLFSSFRVWSGGIWRDNPEPPQFEPDEAPRREREARWMLVPTTALSAVLVIYALGAGPLFEFAQAAASQLLDSQIYIQAVLGEGS